MRGQTARNLRALGFSVNKSFQNNIDRDFLSSNKIYERKQMNIFRTLELFVFKKEYFELSKGHILSEKSISCLWLLDHASLEVYFSLSEQIFFSIAWSILTTRCLPTFYRKKLFFQWFSSVFSSASLHTFRFFPFRSVSNSLKHEIYQWVNDDRVVEPQERIQQMFRYSVTLLSTSLVMTLLTDWYLFSIINDRLFSSVKSQELISFHCAFYFSF